MEFFNDIGSDPFKPSLFELIAQEQLRDLLQPALKYVLAVSFSGSHFDHGSNLLKVFAQQYPRYLLRIVNRHEEFYALIMLIVERHYLRKHSRLSSLTSASDFSLDQMHLLQKTFTDYRGYGDLLFQRTKPTPRLEV